MIDNNSQQKQNILRIKGRIKTLKTALAGRLFKKDRKVFEARLLGLEVELKQLNEGSEDVCDTRND